MSAIKARLKPYLQLMRLHQPTGIFLLLWPCWWSLALAYGGLPPARLLVLFALGAVVMRSAGCIVNDIADRDFDRNVERTRTRPIASGEITIREAGVLLGILLCVAFAIALSLNGTVILLAALSLILVVAYPFMKRITWWPQAFLGLTFNWGALMGWAAIRNDVEFPAVFLYMGSIFWTLGYDTIYAHQDKTDDSMIGVKSTALRLGVQSKRWIFAFYVNAAMFWSIAAAAASNGAYYYIGMVTVLIHFLWQSYSVDIDKPESCMKIFRSNSVLGLLLFLSLCLK